MHDTLDQAIGPAPVSTVDIDRVVAKARRHTLSRRLAVAGAGGTTALVAAGVVAAMTLTSPTTAAGPPPGPSHVQIQPAAPDGTAPVRTGESQDQIRQRLVAALTNGLNKAMPGVRLTDGPTGRPGPVVSEPNPSDNVGAYDADIVLAAPTGQSEVFFQSWMGGRRQALPPGLITWLDSCAQQPPVEGTRDDGHRFTVDCQMSTGSDGQTIVATTERCLDCRSQSEYRYDVYVTWTNARVGVAISRDLKRGARSPATAPLLSLDSIIAIAADPGLTVTS